MSTIILTVRKPSSAMLKPDTSLLRVGLTKLRRGARKYHLEQFGRKFEYPFKLKCACLPVQPYQKDMPFKDQDYRELKGMPAEFIAEAEMFQ